MALRAVQFLFIHFTHESQNMSECSKGHFRFTVGCEMMHSNYKTNKQKRNTGHLPLHSQMEFEQSSLFGVF